MRRIGHIIVAVFLAVAMPGAVNADSHGAKDKEIGPWTKYQARDAYVAGDYATAIRLYRPLAEQGHPGAQSSLGLMYRKGQGVAQDYAQAVKWYSKAAEQGQANAQSRLGFMYYNGDGVAQDYAEAHKWYNIAGANGDENGGKYRDLIAKKMTPAEIAKVQKLARDWMAKHGK